MQFGKLTSYESMQKYFNQMRAVSRTQLLTRIYKTSGNVPEQKIETDIASAFLTILQTNKFNSQEPVVKQILQIFNIHKGQLDSKSAADKSKYLNKKILNEIQTTIPKQIQKQQTIQYQYDKNQTDGQFQWVGVKSNFPNLRSVFQEILLQKVRLFDQDLTRITRFYSAGNKTNIDTISTARTITERCKTDEALKSQKQKGLRIRKRMQSNLQKKGFTNVLIRDHSQFTLKKWTDKQEKQYQKKMSEFRNNFNINGQKSPIIFQFVKKYTQTVKARDNIYRKWEQRQKNGITPEQLRYLCSTSLFLNGTLNKSEKDRLRKNIASLGKDLVSNLQVNIAQKIIETYKQFMKKVSDLRAHYYEQLTEKRKRQYSTHKKKEVQKIKQTSKRQDFLKFKAIFENVCGSEKMKVVLKPRIYRWVKLFIKNIKQRTEQKRKKKFTSFYDLQIFRRLNTSHKISPILLKSKLKCPSTRIIKRQQHKGYRENAVNFIPTARFEYDKSFQRHISSYNSIKVKDNKKYVRQLTGGPKISKGEFITVNIVTKQIVLSSNKCLRAVIAIQAKWKMIYQRRRYLRKVEDYREQMLADFEDRKKTLILIYPLTKAIDLKSLQNRLKRVSMRTLNVFKPYVRVTRKPINFYTSFCQISLPLNQLKLKNSKNSNRRMAEFANMVQQNYSKKLMKSGFVLTEKQINAPIMKRKANAVWWTVQNLNAELTKIFLQGGGNPNSVDGQNNTCLHQAIQNGDLEIIFLLLDFGADLNIKNNKKVTPLYYATQKMLKLLGLQDGNTNSIETNSYFDNNSLYFNPETLNDFYPDHYF